MAASSRQVLASDRHFLTGHDDRVRVRSRLSSANSTRESVTLPHRQQSAGTARRLTGRMCAAAHLSEDTQETAVLLTSELVTNALLHARGSQRLSVTTRSDGVLVEVGDDSRDLPVLQPHDDAASHGRGVQLLESCASSWGARVTTRGKCTWFTLDDGGSGSPSSPRAAGSALLSAPDVEADLSRLDRAQHGTDGESDERDPVASLRDTTEEVGDERGSADRYLMDLRSAEQAGVALDDPGSEGSRLA